MKCHWLSNIVWATALWGAANSFGQTDWGQPPLFPTTNTPQSTSFPGGEMTGLAPAGYPGYSAPAGYYPGAAAPQSSVYPGAATPTGYQGTYGQPGVPGYGPGAYSPAPGYNPQSAPVAGPPNGQHLAPGYQVSPSSQPGGYYSAPSYASPNYSQPMPTGAHGPATQAPGHYAPDHGGSYAPPSAGYGVNSDCGCQGNYFSPGAGYGPAYAPSAGSYSGEPAYGCGPGGGDSYGTYYSGRGGHRGLGQRHGGRMVGPATGSAFNEVYSDACETAVTGARQRNIVGGIGGLVFFRNYGNNVGLSVNGAGRTLFSSDADNSAIGGAEGFFQIRNCNGRGWEGRYWGLFPNDARDEIMDPVWTALSGFNEVWHGPTAQSALTIFNQADMHILSRSNQIHNAEFNRLINAGTFQGIACRTVNYEFLHGGRWFEFDETLTYTAESAALSPMILNYDINTRNSLVGYQLGGRSVSCLSDRWQLNTGWRGGLFNNHVRHRQRFVDGAGVISTINSGPFAGRPYDYSDTQNKLSTLMEAEVGLGYLISKSCRASFGYRLIGVTGLALAPDQIPYNFADGAEIQRIDSNGSLLLHGFFGGLNFCF